jgi:hypothetical protein
MKTASSLLFLLVIGITAPLWLPWVVINLWRHRDLLDRMIKNQEKIESIEKEIAQRETTPLSHCTNEQLTRCQMQRKEEML